MSIGLPGRFLNRKSHPADMSFK
ncbi:protein of unknown function [Serratia sp. Tan611]|nr:protein of unknown function [Serratia sp. Tan611]